MIVELYDVCDQKCVTTYKRVARYTEMGHTCVLERTDGSFIVEERDDYCMIVCRSDDD